MLRNRSDATLSRIDSILTHLGRVLVTAAGTDKLLMTIYYVLKLIYPTIARLRTLRAQQFLARFVQKASDTPLPGGTLVATFASVPGNDRLGSVEASTRNLAGVISDFRIFVRLWGMIGIYGWARSTWYSPPEDSVVRGLVWAQIAANVGFQLFENVAYLASKGVLRGPRFDEKRQTVWWMWSSRFWAGHVGLEALRLLRVWQLFERKSGHAGGKADMANSKVSSSGGIDAETRSVEVNAWRRAWTVNAAYAPMTIHYSLERGLLSDEWLGVVGLIAGTTGFKQIWEQTR